MQTESESFELIIILALVAVFILFQLRRTLGKKTGYDPSKDPRREGQDSDANGDRHRRPSAQTDDEDNVVQMRPDMDTVIPVVNLGLSKSSSFYDIVEKINHIDRSFNMQQFYDGAEYAYGLILNAFWDKDSKTLRSMLSRQVFEQFDGAIKNLEQQKHRWANKLMDIEKIDLVDANLTGSLAEVTVEFTSHMIMSTYDEEDKIVGGNADRAIKVSDIWTFCRDVKSTDPNWTLVATRTG